jgi:hypothetical protein
VRAEYADFTPEENTGRTFVSTGATLIMASLFLFMFTIALILVFFFECAIWDPLPVFISAAGVLGLVGWLLGTIGVLLCLFGPRGHGYWSYAVPAALVSLAHLALLIVILNQQKDFGIPRADDLSRAGRWAAMPTRLNATMYYLASLVYPSGEGLLPTVDRLVFSAAVGVLEMTRAILIMMFLSSLARARREKELAEECTRAAGFVSIGPALLALLMLLGVAIIIESGNTTSSFARFLFVSVQMTGYLILIRLIFPSFRAAKDLVEAYEALKPRIPPP